jgi:pimeloyl-ACP methyl ester carboxylesterase
MQHLLLLHGAIGAKEQLLPLSKSLQHDFIIHNLNFSGHGGEPMPGKPFSIGLFAEQVLSYLDIHVPVGVPVNLFGYSMGGYVGMYIGRHYSGRLAKVITLATKFHWDEAIAAREVQMLNPDTISEKIPAFADQLAKRHAPQDWKQVMENTAAMLLAMGKDNSLKPDDYLQISIPSLLLLGDRDKMVTLEETVAVYKQLPKGQLGVLPNTGHPLEQADIKHLEYVVRRFIRA